MSKPGEHVLTQASQDLLRELTEAANVMQGPILYELTRRIEERLLHLEKQVRKYKGHVS